MLGPDDENTTVDESDDDDFYEWLGGGLTLDNCEF